ncbi:MULTISPECIES: iron-siderophore ABC transporter substrate-binding protein [Nocardioides]|uniref:Iron-siderophore ABC transporter substrate-binding protein n=1 Tax=Nocardioides vastitatis TaxID=2568655 RepID=A0ABW0ZJN8_9ACTN|nr:iron-siderophore ABC transporter substrate-binding protein [Nocardioides sp.]THI98374.1 iron-siderophore ABC transporter substrate-binding protein [Nocardioides sp.]
MRTTRDFRRTTALVTGLASVLALASCGQESDAGTDGTSTVAATDEFPIVIEHAFGETTIEEEPTRVATWGWGSTEAAIAAGVFPVAVAEQVWTVGEDKLLPWVEEAYDEAGVDHPTVLTDPNGGAEVPYDEFIAAEPDLILAPYSGLTKEQYDTLSDIAPVVAFPEAAWTTPWDETIRITANALGRGAQGEKILADIDSYLASEADKHPEFEGRTVAGVWADPNVLSVYTALDPRVAILTKLGLDVAPSVSKLDSSEGGFYYELSYEKADELEADLIVSYHDTEEQAKAMLDDPKAGAIPAVKDGRVAQVVGRVDVSSVSPPTALSFQWEDGMPALIEQIAAALAKE